MAASMISELETISLSVRKNLYKIFLTRLIDTRKSHGAWSKQKRWFIRCLFHCNFTTLLGRLRVSELEWWRRNDTTVRTNITFSGNWRIINAQLYTKNMIIYVLVRKGGDKHYFIFFTLNFPKLNKSIPGLER